MPLDHLLADVLPADVLAVNTLGWILRAAVAAVAIVVIYLFGASLLRKFKVVPDAEPDPETVVPVNIRYRCVVCGAEVTMTAAQDGSEPEAPRHCREDMIQV
jgi:hypothetical protein